MLRCESFEGGELRWAFWGQQGFPSFSCIFEFCASLRAFEVQTSGKMPRPALSNKPLDRSKIIKTLGCVLEEHIARPPPKTQSTRSHSETGTLRASFFQGATCVFCEPRIPLVSSCHCRNPCCPLHLKDVERRIELEVTRRVEAEVARRLEAEMDLRLESDTAEKKASQEQSRNALIADVERKVKEEVNNEVAKRKGLIQQARQSAQAQRGAASQKQVPSKSPRRLVTPKTDSVHNAMPEQKAQEVGNADKDAVRDSAQKKRKVCSG